MMGTVGTASWGRRFLALLVDWVASTLVVVTFVGWDEYSAVGSTAQLFVLPTYIVQSALLTWSLSGSFGKLVTGLRVVPDPGPMRPFNPLRLLLRQVMVALVIPPLVFRPDGRGLHDLVAGTATVRLDTFRARTGR
ncbi:MAG: RDD family protein [Nocardioides sp.]